MKAQIARIGMDLLSILFILVRRSRNLDSTKYPIKERMLDAANDNKR